MASNEATGSSSHSAVQASLEPGVGPQGQQEVEQTEPGVDVADQDPDALRKRFQVSKACTNCAVAHLSCDEVKPCRRCVKKGLTCEDRVRKRRYSRPKSSNRYEDSEDGFEPRKRGRGRPPGSKKKVPKPVVAEDEEYSPIVDNSEDDAADDSNNHEQTPLVTGSNDNWGAAALRAGPEGKGDNQLQLDSLVLAAMAESHAPEKKHNPHQQSLGLLQPELPSSPAAPPSIPQMMRQMASGMLGQAGISQMSLNMPGGMDPNQFQYYMMQMQMPVMIRWRFMGQLKPIPLTIPLAASVLDLYMTVFSVLQRENLLTSSDHIALAIHSNGMAFPIDDKAHALIPLVSLGLADLSAILDVSKMTRA